MNPNVLRLFYKASRVLRLEVTYKLGLDQEVSADTLGFIRHFKGNNKITDPLGPTMLQIIAWYQDTPINIFRESSQSQGKDTLISFFINTLRYFNYKTCKHEKGS